MSKIVEIPARSDFYLKRASSRLVSQNNSRKMAMIGNKLYRNTNSKKEDAAEVDQQIGRMEDDIRRLKIDFDVYFNGGTRRPPLEAKARLESRIKRIADDRSLTFSQRYYFNSIVSR